MKRSLRRILEVKKYVCALALAAAYALPLMASEGGIWTGGGELLRDSQNPWFLENISRVTYCIIQDHEHFPVSDQDLDDRIHFALKYWQDQFDAIQALTKEVNGQRFIKLGTQQFVRRSCEDDVDLRFQFGVLSAEQHSILKSMTIRPQDFVAFTYRTNELRPSDMKGAGFLYVSPETGPLRPTLANQIDRPWSRDRGRRINAILVHELGHIFGIPHLGGSRDMMGVGFPQFLIANESANDPRLSQTIVLPGVLHFQWQRPLTACPKENSKTLEFFAAPSHTNCLILKFLDHNRGEISSMSIGHGIQKVGDISLSSESSMHFQEISKIWMTKNQTAFPWIKTQFAPSPPKVQMQRTGDYIAQDSNVRRKIILDLGPDLFRFTGIFDQTVLLDMFDSVAP